MDIDEQPVPNPRQPLIINRELLIDRTREDRENDQEICELAAAVWEEIMRVHPVDVMAAIRLTLEVFRRERPGLLVRDAINLYHPVVNKTNRMMGVMHNLLMEHANLALGRGNH